MRNVRSFILSSLILLMGASAYGEESLKEKARQARDLFKKKSYPEAAALARQVLLQEPEGRASDKLRVMLCEAKRAGEQVGDPASAYPPTPEPPPSAPAVSRPVRISGDNPQFSDGTRRAGQQGTVAILGFVDQDGCFGDLKVHQSVNDYADQDVLHSAQTWVFVPGFFEGKPVRAPYVLTVNVVLSH